MATPAGTAKADGFERRAHGERTRQRILEAAIELFAEHGYRGTGLSAVAERAGLSGAGLLYYFGSMERLLQEVVAERDRADLVEFHPTLMLDDLRRAGQHVHLTKQLTQLFIVLGAESIEPDAPLHEVFRNRYAIRRQHAMTVLRNELAAGNVRSDINLTQLAIEIPATLLGFEMQWLTDPASFDIVAAVDQYFARLATTIAA